MVIVKDARFIVSSELPFIEDHAILFVKKQMHGRYGRDVTSFPSKIAANGLERRNNSAFSGMSA